MDQNGSAQSMVTEENSMEAKVRTVPETAYLGKQYSKPLEKPEVLPWHSGKIRITLICNEFTSHCPVTGQPDFGSLEIEYIPINWIIETKSLKLYLWKFRDAKGFNEQLVAQIADELFEILRPKELVVRGFFNARGGIKVNPVAWRP